MLPAELVTVFDRFYLLDFGGLAESEEKLLSEFERTKTTLARYDLQDRMRAIAARIKTLEALNSPTAQEKKRLTKLSREFRDCSKQLADSNLT